MSRAAEHTTAPRVEFLRERMNRYEHAVHRLARPIGWSVADMDCSLAERRAHALHMACDRMPIAIGPGELIIGLRTLLPPEGGDGNAWLTPLPTFIRDAEESESVNGGRSTSHNVPGFGKLVHYGLGELAFRARTNMEAATDSARREYLNSFVIACDAAGVLLARYAGLAGELARQPGEPGRRAELTRISEACDHLVTGPPRNLHEAMQLLWISWSLIVLEVGCLVSMGRLDQTLAPYWPTDPSEQAHAQELMDCFIVKCNDQNELWRGSSLINNQLMLSGLTRDGADATNRVTWSVLSSLDRLNMPDPQPAVRLHDNSMANLLVAGMRTTPADADWEGFLGTYRQLIAEEAAGLCNRYSEDLQSKPGLPCPLLSVSMDDCIETGLDFANGGLAIRDKGVMLAQPVVMVNSLAALHKVVYGDGAATLGEVLEACEANWVGHEDLQRRLQDAPKWGNDDDAADLPGAEMFRFAAEEIWKHRMPDGSRFLSGIHQAHHVAAGHGMGATPDGRSQGQPMSPTLAPANGTEKKGPTAVMKSVTKIDPMVVQWNSSLTMAFDPASLRGDNGLMKFEALIRTWLQLRGPQLQINVVSGDTLRAARDDPDSYRDLIVRVWGFCDRFASLQPMYQDELIERTQHSM